MKIKTILLLLLITSIGISNAQIKSLSIGTTLGVGEIKSNSPSIASMGGGFFIGIQPSFADDFSFRFSFIYNSDIDYFLPGNSTNKSYPYITSYSIKIYTEQLLQGIIYSEEGVGPLVINDRTFDDTDVWNYGLSFSALVGLNFQNDQNVGFKIGVGFDYGNTFNNTAANYYLTYIQLQYQF